MTAAAGPEVHLGLDLGGGRIKAALLAGNAVLAQGTVPTPRGGTAEVFGALVGLGHELVAGRRLAGCALAVPGVVDMAAGLVRFLPNVPGDWDGQPAAAVLSRAIGAPCALLNDVRAAAWGELGFGAGRGCGDFVLIAVGTGIGGAVVTGGRLLLGHGGHAGEVGHQLAEPHGPRCGCGGWGCLETVASGPALAAAGVRVVLQGLPTALREACGGDVGEITARLVTEVAQAGDGLCRELVLALAQRIGAAAGNVVLLCNPQRVIIGGGLSLAGDILLGGVRQALEARIGWYLRYAPTEVVAAALGDQAGALGAAAWARDRAGAHGGGPGFTVVG